MKSQFRQLASLKDEICDFPKLDHNQKYPKHIIVYKIIIFIQRAYLHLKFSMVYSSFCFYIFNQIALNPILIKANNQKMYSL